MLWCQGVQNIGLSININSIVRAEVHRMTTLHARSRQTDGRTDRQTDEHHGNSVTIHSNEDIAR